jgi:hypothetical protein
MNVCMRVCLCALGYESICTIAFACLCFSMQVFTYVCVHIHQQSHMLRSLP